MPNKQLKNVFNRLGSKKPSKEDYDNNNNNNNYSSSDLKTLHAYSRMITCEKSTVSPSSSSSSSCNSSNPFYNLKIVIVNNSAPKGYKRRLDDSCLDDTYETPFKKFCRTNVVSPDLACVLDSYNSLPDVASALSTTDTQEAPYSTDNALKNKVKWESEAVVPEQSSGHVQSAPAKEVGNKQGGAVSPSCPFSNEPGAWSESTRLEPDNIPMNHGPIFDFDVDKIMCLSPFDSDWDSDEDNERLINVRNSVYKKRSVSNGNHGEVHQSKPLVAPNPTWCQVNGENVGEQMVRKAEQNKDELKQQGKEDGVRGEIYFSTSYLEALQSGKKVHHTATNLQPHTEPSPAVRKLEETRGPHVVLGERQPPCPAGLPQTSRGLAVPSQLHQAFSQDVECDWLSGAPLVPLEGSNTDLETDAQEVWYIGAPILESSLCYGVPVESNAVSVGQVVSEDAGRDLDPEGVTVATSCKIDLPLNVQETLALPSVLQHIKKPLKLPEQNVSDARGVQEPLKKIVVKTTSPVLKTSLGQNVVKNTTVQDPLPQQNTIQTIPVQKVSPLQKVLKVEPAQASSTDQKEVKTRPVQHAVPRPVVYDREENWHREKRHYVESVNRHMRENTDAVGSMGVMTELMNLMNQVAHQVPGTNRKQWQHPSDLTRRNYQKRFGNESAIYTLDEWQFRNGRKYLRFANVPQIFERSPV